MLLIELEPKDFDKGKAFVRIGRIAAAIARANGSDNPELESRKFLPLVNAGVKKKLLNPVDPETLRPLPNNNWGSGIVSIEELIEWGAHNRFLFREKPVMSVAMTDESRIEWRRRQLWRLHEAVSILIGLEPLAGDKRHPNDVGDGIAEKPIRARWELLYNDAKDAMDLQSPLLPWIEPRIGSLYMNRLVQPGVFVSFAQTRDIELPTQLASLLPKPLSLDGEQLTELYKKQAEFKRDAGRYTLEEAAATIEKNTGARAADTLAKLIQAVLAGRLPVHEPGQEARYLPVTIRGFWEESYWDDLNAWLTTHESRIAWRFPDPNAELDTIAQGDEKIAKPLARQRHQESEILRVIRDLGYTPNALPKAQPGKVTVKAAVRIAFKYSDAVFEKAWERLRKQGEIANIS